MLKETVFVLPQVKEDNSEIAIMEQQISDLSDQMSRYNDEATQLDQDLEENQSERNVKYRDLRKREETMDQVSTVIDRNYGTAYNLHY